MSASEVSFGYSKPRERSYGNNIGAIAEQFTHQRQTSANHQQTFYTSGHTSAPLTTSSGKPALKQIALVIVLLILFMPIAVLAAPFGKKDQSFISPYFGSVASSLLTTSPQTAAVAPQAAPATTIQVELTQQQTNTPAETASSAIDRPAVAHHTDDYNVAAPPSVSASAIDRVLAQYNSPAQGLGAAFYDLGLKYNIDPAYALAFYIHESAAGTKGVARFTKGIGNIRVTAGYNSYEGYRAYDTYEQGIEDFYKLIRELYIDGWGLTTPDTIIQRYAPWGDNNNPVVYANNVKQMVDSWQEK